MKPCEFKERTHIAAKNQKEYLPLSIHVSRDRAVVTSCWKLSVKERLQVLFTGTIWLQQLTYNKPLQPQRPCIDNPFVKDKS